MNISVIGVGYVGLTTGTCFAELGNNVLCMDTDEEKISKLKKGESPIYEPEIEEMIMSNSLNNRLNFTTNLKKTVEFADVIFIAVGTPTNEDNVPELKYIFKAAREIASNMDSYKVLVVKSTVPVGTGRKIRAIVERVLKKKNSNIEFDMASNPEFLREGTAIYDFMYPDRVVIGVENERSKGIMTKLYNFHINANKPYIVSTIKAAEMIKYVSNAFLATKISYINEIAIMCERYNIDVSVVAKGMGLDKRIGDKFLMPGPGFGGSCFPKDTKGLMHIGKTIGYEPQIVKAVIEVNNRQINFIIKKIENLVKNFSGKAISVLGASFKPDTDDIRESPAIPIIEFLLKRGAKVKLYDPKAMDNCMRVLKKVEYCKDVYKACENSDCIILMTEWEEFREVDFVKLRDIVNKPILIDLRNMYDPNYVKQSGFIYEGVGRK
jgi:UDPglucose 6-dehydrogenase